MEPFSVDSELQRTVQQLRAVLPQGAPPHRHYPHAQPQRFRRTALPARHATRHARRRSLCTHAR